MDEQQVRSIVRSEMQNSTSGNRFGLTSIPRHVHNGTDSPLAFQPVLTYIGLVGYDGTAILLPKGWSITLTTSPVDVYTITHNLNTLFYSVTLTPAQSTNNIVTWVSEGFQNEFDVAFFGSFSAGSEITTSFFFNLTVIANKNTQTPVYVGTYV